MERSGRDKVRQGQDRRQTASGGKREPHSRDGDVDVVVLLLLEVVRNERELGRLGGVSDGVSERGSARKLMISILSWRGGFAGQRTLEQT